MKKTKKQLLGLAGLAAVGVMTAVAYAMPTPDAAAAEQTTYECNDSDSDPNNDCAKGDGGAQVQVRVSEGNPAITITSPQDGSNLSDSDVKVAGTYSEVTKIDFYLTYKKNNGVTSDDVTHRVDLDSFTPTETSSGTYAFNVDIAQYGQGDYTLHVLAQGYNGATREDTTTFSYRAMTVEVDPETTPNGDPSVDITIDDQVDKVMVQVYNKNEPLFKDENGDPKFIEVSRDDIDLATGKIKVHLPFEENGAEAGEYTVVSVAYDRNNDIVSMVTTPLNYKPVVPDVPNTSAGFFADLNITHIDYLITGLIVFGLVAGFALYLVCRKSRR